MIRVAQPADPLEARLLLGALEENGIRAVVQGEALWGARGELPFTPESAPSIWVADEADAGRAREILAVLKSPVNPTRCPQCGADLHGVTEPRCPKCDAPFRIVGTWTCPDCKEVSGTQFSHCWSCGAARGELPEDPQDAVARDVVASNCARCGGTGYVVQWFFPTVLMICGGFLGYAALNNLADYSYLGTWAVGFLFRRFLFAALAALCYYVALRIRRTRCACGNERLEVQG